MTTLLLLQAAEVSAPERLTGVAWVFMLVSMLSVTLLTVWCFVRITRGRAHFDPDGTGPAHPPVPGREDTGAARDP